MLRKIPKWVLAGGILLSFVSGWVNAVGILGLHQTLTHMTGNLSNLSLKATSGDFAAAANLAAVMTSFIMGAAVSGMIIRKSVLSFGRRYGVVLMIESAALCVAAQCLRHKPFLGECLAAAAFGLQNAMAALFSASIIRTTHMTGIATDLGFQLGHALVGIPVDKRMVLMYAALFMSFFLGGAASAMVYPRLGSDSVFIPAAIVGLMGIVYFIYRRTKLDGLPPPP